MHFVSHQYRKYAPINIAIHKLLFVREKKHKRSRKRQDVETDRESDRMKHAILRCLDSKQRATSSIVS